MWPVAPTLECVVHAGRVVGAWEVAALGLPCEVLSSYSLTPLDIVLGTPKSSSTIILYVPAQKRLHQEAK